MPHAYKRFIVWATVTVLAWAGFVELFNFLATNAGKNPVPPAFGAGIVGYLLLAIGANLGRAMEALEIEKRKHETFHS